MHIKKLSDEFKPREKLMKNGASHLTDIELMAIIIGRGVRNNNALDVAKELMWKYGSFANLKDSNISLLRNTRGIGSVKAVEIIAMFEIFKRLNNMVEENDDVYDEIIKTVLKRSKFNKEFFWIFCLDEDDKIIYNNKLYDAEVGSITISPNLVVSEALKANAKSFICVHNHPSGNVKPSLADEKTTIYIKLISEDFDLVLKDHIILNSKGEFSKIDV